MPKGSFNSHDIYAREVLSHPDNAASELREILEPELVASLDLDNLIPESTNFFTEDQRAEYGDILFRTTLNQRPAFIYILIEHQTKNDPLMAYRLLSYMVHIWRRYLDKHPNAKTLPAIIPLVVHSSRSTRRWTAPTQFADLIKADDPTRTLLTDFVPHFRYLVDDVSPLTIDQLRARELNQPLMLMLFMQKIVGRNPDVISDMMDNVDLFEQILHGPDGARLLTQAFNYLFTLRQGSYTTLQPLTNKLGPKAEEIIVTIAETLRNEGRTEGRTEGVSGMLISQLELKFGTLEPSQRARIDRAPMEQLRTWCVRVLTADSVAETLR